MKEDYEKKEEESYIPYAVPSQEILFFSYGKTLYESLQY